MFPTPPSSPSRLHPDHHMYQQLTDLFSISLDPFSFWLIVKIYSSRNYRRGGLSKSPVNTHNDPLSSDPVQQTAIHTAQPALLVVALFSQILLKNIIPKARMCDEHKGTPGRGGHQVSAQLPPPKLSLPLVQRDKTQTPLL